MTNFSKATVVYVEMSIGSGRVAAYRMTSDEYIKLRQLYALGQNNCFLPDEDGVARWAARAVNHYEGLRIDRARLIPIPGMDTKVYQGRWRVFEAAVCKAVGAEHIGYEYAGKVKGYIPDGLMFGVVSIEIKSRRGVYRKGQTKKTHR